MLVTQFLSGRLIGLSAGPLAVAQTTLGTTAVTVVVSTIVGPVD